MITSAVFSTYASAVVIVLASIVVGRALMRALGREETTWIEPVLGLAALAVVGSVAIRALDSGAAAAIALGLLIIAALVVLRLRILPAEDLRLAAAPALVAAVLASLPLLASQRIGVLGVGINNDLAGHLLWAEWLRDQDGPVPTDLVDGYPIGPHSLAAALGEAFGFEMTEAFVGLLIAVAVLTALTALALLRELPPLRRAIGSGLVALPYLAASALALGGFKETIMALILLGFAVALATLEREYPSDLAIKAALGILGAGALAVYSYPGLFWLLAAGGLLALAGATRALRRRELVPALRRSAPVLAIPVVVLAVVGAAEITRAHDFNERSGLEATIEGDSKLTEAVSPLEALGAWPDGNFLAGTEGPPGYLMFGALGILALAVAVPWWLRRRSLAIPLGVLGAGVIYLGTLADAGLYVQAKALTVPAALVMLTIVAALIEPRRRDPKVILAVLFVAVAGCSSFLALRDAVVAPSEHADELGEIRKRTSGEWTLYLTGDRYTDYQLRSTRVGSPFLSAQTIVPARPGKDFVLPSDFDSVSPEALDLFRWVLTSRSAYRSEPPPNLRLVLRTDSYELWRRVGPTPLRFRVLDEKGRPGKVLGCGAVEGDAREALASGTAASTFAALPVTARPETWMPSAEPAPGESATRSLRPPPGRWRLSLQYLSPLRGISVRAAGESFVLPPSLEGAVPGRMGPYWEAGVIRSDGGPLKVSVRVDRLSAVQDLLGVNRKAALGGLALTPVGEGAELPVAAACGRYLDHYAVAEDSIDRAGVRRRRELARLSLSGRYRPEELEAAQEAASG